MAIVTSINDEVYLHESPPVPGLVFRHFRGPADYPHILAVISNSKAVDQVERSDTLEQIAHRYSHLDHCDPYQDALFAEVDGQVAGYVRAWWERETDGTWLGFTYGCVLPEWRRKGVGTTLLRFAEDRLRSIARGLEAKGLLAPDSARYFIVELEGVESARRALLEKEGYSEIRHEYTMVRPNLENIPAAPMPTGLEVRPVKREHLRQIWDAAQEAFRDHWGYVEPTEENYQGWSNDPELDFSLWKVAWDADQVAGMVMCFISRRENEEYHRKRGYTEGISVRRPWRRRGLARALLVQSLQVLKEQGMEEAALGVDPQNPNQALHLYESVGFQQVGRHSIYRKAFE